MDKLDAKILDLLQGNGELTAAEIADRVGLSKAPCWRRIQKLQDAGRDQSARWRCWTRTRSTSARRCS